jgi:hypothetical protein
MLSSSSKLKVSYNKLQKEKQLKILNYYRRSLKSSPAPDIIKPVKKTRKQHFGQSDQRKLTKSQQTLEIQTHDNDKIMKDKKKIEKDMKDKEIVIMD